MSNNKNYEKNRRNFLKILGGMGGAAVSGGVVTTFLNPTTAASQEKFGYMDE